MFMIPMLHVMISQHREDCIGRRIFMSEEHIIGSTPRLKYACYFIDQGYLSLGEILMV